MAYQGAITIIGTGDGSGGSVTINQPQGVISCGTLTTAAVTVFAVTLTNSYIATSSVIILTVQYAGTLVTAGIPTAMVGTISGGSCIINVLNIGLINALNGACKIHFRIL